MGSVARFSGAGNAGPRNVDGLKVRAGCKKKLRSAAHDKREYLEETIVES